MILPLRTKNDIIYQFFGKSESFTKILVNQSDLPKIKTALVSCKLEHFSELPPSPDAIHPDFVTQQITESRYQRGNIVDCQKIVTNQGAT
jgi:hypothetical protein